MSGGASQPAYGVAAYALHEASASVLGVASFPAGNDRRLTTHADVIRTKPEIEVEPEV